MMSKRIEGFPHGSFSVFDVKGMSLPFYDAERPFVFPIFGKIMNLIFYKVNFLEFKHALDRK